MAHYTAHRFQKDNANCGDVFIFLLGQFRHPIVVSHQINNELYLTSVPIFRHYF